MQTKQTQQQKNLKRLKTKITANMSSGEDGTEK